MINEESEVGTFYNGRHIFITGATGFIGKVLVEKLLRTCSDLHSIYILMRQKNGVDINARFNELLSATVFDNVRQNNPDSINKLVPISGDISLPQLGLSQDDQQLLIKNVSVVFHSAATVKFDEALKQSINMNLLATKRLIELSRKMIKLEAFVHVSTAYCNCNQYVVQEKVYPPPADPETIIKCVESFDEKTINSITPQLISDRPNTYTFTKALAESVLCENNSDLPIAIVRPSIVTATWKEPFGGWIDNLNGPTGIFVGVSKGVLRSLHANGALIADFVPVDILVNLMIVVPWHLAATKQNKIMIFNCSSGTTNPLKWGEVENLIIQSVRENPTTGVFWYPGGSFKKHAAYNKISILIYQMLPAYLIDMLIRLAGKRPFLVKVQNKIYRATSIVEFFTTHEWKFVNNNMFYLYEQMNSVDKNKYNFNINDVDWKNYILDYWLGVRRFVLKENPNNMKKASSNLNRLYWLNQISQLMGLVLFWYLFLRNSNKFSSARCCILNILIKLIKVLKRNIL